MYTCKHVNMFQTQMTLSMNIVVKLQVSFDTEMARDDVSAKEDTCPPATVRDDVSAKEVTCAPSQ